MFDISNVCTGPARNAIFFRSCSTANLTAVFFCRFLVKVNDEVELT